MEGRPACLHVGVGSAVTGELVVLAALVFGYALGSIPFGWLLTRAAGLGDIRRVGSGNIGATNVLRTGRKDIAAATLLLDGGKGAAAVLITQALTWPELGWLAGLAAVVGHCTSPWMGGRGGKGVSTGLGMVLGMAWLPGALVCAVWVAAMAGSRRSSVGALAAFIAAPVLMAWLVGIVPGGIVLLVSVVVIARHGDNIARLRAGTEPRVGR